MMAQVKKERSSGFLLLSHLKSVFEKEGRRVACSRKKVSTGIRICNCYKKLFCIDLSDKMEGRRVGGNPGGKDIFMRLGGG